jgi:hypothetical protein
MRRAEPVQTARAEAQVSDLDCAKLSRGTDSQAPARLPSDGAGDKDGPGGSPLRRKRVLVHPRCSE